MESPRPEAVVRTQIVPQRLSICTLVLQPAQWVLFRGNSADARKPALRPKIGSAQVLGAGVAVGALQGRRRWRIHGASGKPKVAWLPSQDGDSPSWRPRLDVDAYDGADRPNHRSRELNGNSRQSAGSWATEFRRRGVDVSTIAGKIVSAHVQSLALLVGYNGSQYKGLQSNALADGTFLPTVDAELELALLKTGAISINDFGYKSRLGWSHAGRTDAGVSAACNVVAASLHVERGGEDSLVERVNSALPPDIQLHGFACVAEGFDTRMEGSRREYTYILPGFSISQSVDYVAAELATLGCTIKELELDGPSKIMAKAAGLCEMRIQAAQLDSFRAALACFEGEHFFANFCASSRRKVLSGGGLDYSAPEAWRIIHKCQCSEPFLDKHGREWLEVNVSGESFLTHQIRRMLGTAILVAQGLVPLAVIHAGLSRPGAWSARGIPPLGLIFRRPWFERSRQGSYINGAIVKPAVRSRLDLWFAELRDSILEESAGMYSWVTWLAFVAEKWPEAQHRVAGVLRDHEAELRRQQEAMSGLQGRMSALRRAAAGLDLDSVGR